MDEIEEQNMEIEALKAIYMDDFKELELDPPKRIQVVLVPNPGADNNHEFTLPGKYPKVLPEIKLKDTFGLDTSNLQEIQDIAKKQATENIGTPMVYTIAQACKEWLDDHNIDSEELEKMKKLKIQEEKEKKRAEGTPVNKETFANWANKFYAAKLAEEKKLEQERKKKLTGRALFENYKDLVNSDLIGEDEGGEAVTIDWNVFSNELEEIDEELLADDKSEVV